MKVIEVIADAGHLDTITGIADQQQISDRWQGPQSPDGRVCMRLLVEDGVRQTLLDRLQGALGSSDNARILVLPVEAALPRPQDEEQKSTPPPSATREELFDKVARNARLDSSFMLLVCLSTVVAAIGLVKDNVAAVIGAMVIAPLLGPNIALALGSALGDGPLMWQSLKTNLAGLCLAFFLSCLIGLAWPVDLASHELMSRTDVGLDSVALALASGAAAALSLTAGVSSVLVGVMVAVALLPPTAAAGLMLGSDQWAAAGGAGLLLAVNVVCVNLSAKLVMLVRGVRPRTWLEKRRARQSMTVYILVWLVSLSVLVAAILIRHPILVP